MAEEAVHLVSPKTASSFPFIGKGLSAASQEQLSLAESPRHAGKRFVAP